MQHVCGRTGVYNSASIIVLRAHMGQTQSTTKRILFVVERGGYALHTDRFVLAGYDVAVEHSMRKALVRVKLGMPDVIVAEFNFAPKYGDRISNLEPLLASVQAAGGDTKVIVFVEREYTHHLDKLRAQFPVFDALLYPIQPEALLESVQRAVQSGA